MVYVVTNLGQLLSVVIPFLLQYNKLSARNKELAVFIEVCNLIKQGQHLNEQGVVPAQQFGKANLSQLCLVPQPI